MSLDLNVIWFVLIGVLFTGYAVLDGFDLGVGALHLFAKTDEERRIMLNSIGPVWDGNEVWLVTGGGALFAAFPMVYATVFSGFYIAFMFFLFALIFRAVAIEFRSKQPMKWWRNTWDRSFAVASVLSALLIGVALGNIARGIPIDAQGEFAGTFLSLLNPFALLVGVTTVALFTMHASIYVAMKTEGDLRERMKKYAKKLIFVFLALYLFTSAASIFGIPHMTANFRAWPLLLSIPLFNVIAIANIFREFKKGRDGMAFVSSCLSIVFLLVVFGLGIFPNLVWSVPDAANSLSIYNAASSQRTLKIMLIMAVIGMPLVLSYTISIYWIFRGKVKLDSSSY